MSASMVCMIRVFTLGKFLSAVWPEHLVQSCTKNKSLGLPQCPDSGWNRVYASLHLKGTWLSCINACDLQQCTIREDH